MKRSHFSTTIPLLAASFFALAASANASDLGIDSRADQYEPAPAQAQDDWTGLYLGAFGGWASADWDGPFSYDDAGKYAAGGSHPGPDITFDSSDKNIGDEDWFGGLAFGADKQFGNIVLGGVVDVSYGDLSATERFVPYPKNLDPDNAGDPVWDATAEIEYFGTARVRAGYLFQPSLLGYVTGGLAWAKVESSINSIHDPEGVKASSFASSENNHIGWAVGSGLEWQLTNNISLFGEYLYIDLGKVDYRHSGQHATDNFHPDLELQTIKAGLNYKF